LHSPISIHSKCEIFLEWGIVNEFIQWHILCNGICGICDLGTLKTLLKLETALPPKLVRVLDCFVLCEVANLALDEDVIATADNSTFVAMGECMNWAKVMVVVVKGHMAVMDSTAWMANGDPISNDNRKLACDCSCIVPKEAGAFVAVVSKLFLAISSDAIVAVNDGIHEAGLLVSILGY
jgi:hypothetical protein